MTLDGSPASEQIIPYALLMAGGLRADAKVLRAFSQAPVIGHYAAIGTDWEKVEEAMRNETTSYLEEVRSGLETEGRSSRPPRPMGWRRARSSPRRARERALSLQ